MHKCARLDKTLVYHRLRNVTPRAPSIARSTHTGFGALSGFNPNETRTGNHSSLGGGVETTMRSTLDSQKRSISLMVNKMRAGFDYLSES